ncbi:MAG: YihY/virulence factor BrkB family protein [Caulobacteraceae bacterium]|nr:YihY/virulence factor BrkB family protein [Caulobacter sp.]
MKRASAEPRRRKRGKRRGAAPPVLPWYIIALGVAVAGATSAAQKRAVELLTTPEIDRTDPLPEIAPGWLKSSRRARSLWTIVNRVQLRIARDNLMLIAAGIAFYAMFAIFPALGALVSIYGLFGDTHVVQTQVQQLTALLPRETAALINESLNALLSKPAGSLNFGLLISLGLAIWGARAGISAMMSGLNVAIERPEQRSVLHFQVLALGLTLGAIVFAIVALTAVAIVPIVVAFLPVDEVLKSWLAFARWPILGVFILLALDVIYRFGPSQRDPRWHLVSVGTVFAGGFWIFASWAFSLYVTRFGSYDTTYGSLGAVIVLLLWFWISALIALTGATIDSVRADVRRGA